MKARRTDCRPQLIAKRKSWQSSDRSSPCTIMKMVRHDLHCSMTCSDHSVVNADEGESDDPDMESQDEADMGYDACPGGRFTSVVSIFSHTDIELKVRCR